MVGNKSLCWESFEHNAHLDGRACSREHIARECAIEVLRNKNLCKKFKTPPAVPLFFLLYKKNSHAVPLNYCTVCLGRKKNIERQKESKAEREAQTASLFTIPAPPSTKPTPYDKEKKSWPECGVKSRKRYVVQPHLAQDTRGGSVKRTSATFPPLSLGFALFFSRLTGESAAPLGITDF